MINNSSTGKWRRLRRKQQDTQFGNRLQAGMNCSPFEAKAILNCVYEVYQPFFDNSASMKPGQICFEVVGVENSAKEKLSDCQWSPPKEAATEVEIVCGKRNYRNLPMKRAYIYMSVIFLPAQANGTK